MGWESVTLGQMLWPLAGVGVILMGIGSWAKWVRPIAQKIDLFLEDWNGRPARPGYAAEPGFPERMRTVEDAIAGMQQSVADIQYQVKANGGNSAHDHVMSRMNQIAAAVPCPIPEPSPETPGGIEVPPASGTEAP